MKRILALLSTLLLTSVPSIAQDESCSTLTIQKGSTRPDYDTLRLRLEGAPANSLGWLALGATDQPMENRIFWITWKSTDFDL